jgi:hypothetical protein
MKTKESQKKKKTIKPKKIWVSTAVINIPEFKSTVYILNK